jgi:DHA1 family bicyclomycin/chloramphenicol resistance-like MFS transporter
MVMAVFIMVPVIAPALGQGILFIADWRAIFAAFLAVAAIVSAWFGLRQAETLPPARRVPFSLGQIARGIAGTVGNRAALGYTLTGGLIFGAFVSYLISATQILQIQYGLGERFPLYFGALAVAIGAASLLNSRLVMRYGMRRLAGLALRALTGTSLLALAVAFALAGHPPLLALMAYLGVAFFCMGLLFGNVNAMAMEPLGDIAGIGAAVVGSLMTLISLSLGTLIGQAYDGTVLPMITGFALLGLAALWTMHWTERGRQGD